jgi:predicted dehydrogenase
MALDALWAVIIPEVSRVSEVQAPIHAGLRDTPSVLPEVSGVSGNDGNGPGVAVIGSADTPDTSQEIVRYQALHAWALGCTLDTPDTHKKINAEIQTTEAAATLTLSESKRLFRKRGPWLTDTEQPKARAYHAHHFNCHTCIAAGRGIRYSRRCAVGLALWIDYTDENNLQTERMQHGQA